MLQFCCLHLRSHSDFFFLPCFTFFVSWRPRFFHFFLHSQLSISWILIPFLTIRTVSSYAGSSTVTTGDGAQGQPLGNVSVTSSLSQRGKNPWKKWKIHFSFNLCNFILGRLREGFSKSFLGSYRFFCGFALFCFYLEIVWLGAMHLTICESAQVANFVV